jgi:putative Mg2+ transporter-C (MgtC) family protein
MTEEFIIRILIATALGAVIGLDREYRTKAAGFRTHVLVALGSALFMIISVHGFDDLPKDQMTLRMDPARIAAQVVTGIGFIGAGTIIFQKNVVKGLTTAAGLWVTAAVGMACGVGMYVLAMVSTLLVLICFEAFNFFLHKIRGKKENEE